MKKIIRAILFPPTIYRCIFGIFSLLASGLVFLFGWYDHSVSYVVYCASALGLHYIITGAILPAVSVLKKILMRSRYIRRYCEDPIFNSRVILYRGLLINILYALFKLITGVYYRSTWMIAISVYYITLIILKGRLVQQDIRFIKADGNAKRAEQWRSYRMTGWLLLLLNVSLSGIVVHVVRHNKSFSYPGMIIFAIAAYTFYRIGIAVVRIIKNRKRKDILFSAARAIDFCFAVTSMFTLQTAMFSSFAIGMDTVIPNIITGTAAAVIVTVIALYMLMTSRNNLSDPMRDKG